MLGVGVARALLLTLPLPLLLALAGGCSGASHEPAARERAPVQAFAQRFGSSGDDFARALVALPGGGALISGYTDGAFDAAASGDSWDAFLVRVDARGERVWARQWGSDAPEFAQAVVLDAARHAFVAGYTPGSIDQQPTRGGRDAFLSCFDDAGEYAWTRQWGTAADDYVYAAASTGAGVVVVGYTRGAFEGFENTGEADAFVTLLDAAGAVQWTRQLGTSGTDYAQSVHVAASGLILVAGYTAGKLGKDADLGAEDAFLLALEPDGSRRFLRQWGSATTDYALAVSSDPDGNAYVAGYTYGALTDAEALGGEDAYVSKLDVDGQLLWTRQLGTAARDSARFISVGASGDVFVGGDTEGAFAADASAGGRDAFLVRLNAEGEESFRAQWGGSDSEFSLSADIDEQAHTLYVGGYAESASSSSSRDVLLSKWSL